LRKPVWQTVTNRKERSAQIFLRARNFQESVFILFSQRVSAQGLRAQKEKKIQHQMSKRKNSTNDTSQKKTKEEKAVTPKMLRKACKSGELSIVELAIAQKIDLEAPNKRGATPFFLACEYGRALIVTELMKQNVNMETLNQDGDSPFYRACQEGRLGIVQELIRQNINIKKTGFTPLHAACARGQSAIVKELILASVDINTTDYYGASPLHEACRHGHHKVAKILMKQNADINRIDVFGQTPFYLACAHGHTAIVNELIKRNADIDQPNCEGTTPFRKVCKDIAYADIVDILVHIVNINEIKKNLYCYRGMFATEYKPIQNILTTKIQTEHWSTAKMLLNGHKQEGSPISLMSRDLLSEITKEMKALELQ
jgi:ankyrin repeat protein